jgi:hypothetical protein
MNAYPAEHNTFQRTKSAVDILANLTAFLYHLFEPKHLRGKMPRRLTDREKRLAASDVSVFGRRVFGPSWESALAQELGIELQTVRRWATGEVPVSGRYSTQVVQLAGERRLRRIATIKSTYSRPV